jgi:hypothetical protein
MKIKLSELKQIIKEEMNLMLEYEQYIYRNQDGELRVSDDDGHDEPFEDYSGKYRHLRRGEEGEAFFGSGRRGPYDDLYDDRGSRRRRRW